MGPEFHTSLSYYDLLFSEILKMEKAYNLLGEMKEVGVQPNTHCFNPIIMGYGTQVIFYELQPSLVHLGQKISAQRKLVEMCTSLYLNEDVIFC